MADPDREHRQQRLFRNWRVSLTSRILAVNIIALALLAGSLFYLDSYRHQLLAERFRLARAEAEIAAEALDVGTRPELRQRLVNIGAKQQLRLLVFDREGRLTADSFALAKPSFAWIDPESEPWYQQVARLLDRGMDFVLGTPAIPDFPGFRNPHDVPWPEAGEARAGSRTVVRERLAPDRTPVITAAVPIRQRQWVLLTIRNAVDVTQKVRDARQTLAIVVGAAFIISILLSLFLARTIVQPLRMLVRAAVRVRLGRDRAVIVPRLPERRDEIGLLARAISDMTTALRQRIDAVESFAADVAHELKNPLASLRSALESLDKVEDLDLRRQLAGIAAHDLQRIHRLITEIAEASRIDAELSRTTFEPVDMLALVDTLVEARELRKSGMTRQIEVIHHGSGPWLVAGDIRKLERVLENLLDNAASFSPPGGQISVELASSGGMVEISISDQGPGIPPEVREDVFERFHSLRPADEDFGSHSGLGLAIARSIVEAHDGTLRVEDRADGASGARLAATLPAWKDG